MGPTFGISHFSFFYPVFLKKINIENVQSRRKRSILCEFGDKKLNCF